MFSLKQAAMLPFKKKIVTDEAMRPVAVLIDYQDWQRIEQLLEAHQSLGEAREPSLGEVSTPSGSGELAEHSTRGAREPSPEEEFSLARYAGAIKLTEDPLDYQQQVRDGQH